MDLNLRNYDVFRSFWQMLSGDLTETDWDNAISRAAICLAGLPVSEPEMGTASAMILSIQTEAQFGIDHWKLSRKNQIYYRVVRPLLPDFLRPYLRTLFLSRQKNKPLLNWPIEDRYVRFQFEIIAQLMIGNRLDTMNYVHFWPQRKRFAFVLTHDIETKNGQDFVRQVAALDEKFGFRSSFNFIPEKYHVDLNLITELKGRGFEIGVHGLKHDGLLFSSRAVFDKRARKINQYFKQWGAVGFRSPMTHRNPEWMQAFEVEYDLSFFDTDPYEPIPGGTMSIWPFQLGRFVELPYTLVQDHTLMVTLGETTPRLWLEKVDFIKQYCGMALVNTHPDYLSRPKHLMIYEDFLRQMSEMKDYWHALPRDVARWWKKRAQFNVDDGFDDLQTSLPGATIGSIRLVKDGIEIAV